MSARTTLHRSYYRQIALALAATICSHACAQRESDNQTISQSDRSDAFLLIGTDDGTDECISLFCPNNVGNVGFAEGWYTLECDVAVRAMTQDVTTGNVLMSSGDGLYAWNMVTPRSFVGTFKVNTSVITIVSLAMHDGKLYGTRNSSSGGWPEGLYSIDPLTAQCELVWAYPSSEWDIGGIDFDTEGTMFGVNDDLTPNGRGLYRIDFANQQMQFITAYPPIAGGSVQSDVDALAIWDGVAHFVIDQPGVIERYDINAGVFLSPLDAPWTTPQTFSGATFALAHPTTPACDSCKQPCFPDCDQDRQLTLLDHTCWFELYYNEDPRGDCDGNGGVTLEDYVCFRAKFLLGCRGFPAFVP